MGPRSPWQSISLAEQQLNAQAVAQIVISLEVSEGCSESKGQRVEKRGLPPVGPETSTAEPVSDSGTSCLWPGSCGDGLKEHPGFARFLAPSSLNTPEVKDSRKRSWISLTCTPTHTGARNAGEMNRGPKRDETVSVPQVVLSGPFTHTSLFLRCLTGFSARCSPTRKTKSHHLNTANTSRPKGAMVQGSLFTRHRAYQKSTSERTENGKVTNAEKD